MQWRHTQSPTARNQNLTIKPKNLATIFWDRKGPLLVKCFPRGDTINAAAYSETLKKLRRLFKTSGAEC
jgi:hypothetical protein